MKDNDGKIIYRGFGMKSNHVIIDTLLKRSVKGLLYDEKNIMIIQPR